MVRVYRNWKPHHWNIEVKHKAVSYKKGRERHMSLCIGVERGAKASSLFTNVDATLVYLSLSRSNSSYVFCEGFYYNDNTFLNDPPNYLTLSEMINLLCFVLGQPPP